MDKLYLFQLQLASPDKRWNEMIVICDSSSSLHHLGSVSSYTGHLTHICWHTMAGLTNDTMYDIKLVAVNSHGQSQESKVFSFYVTGINRMKGGKLNQTPERTRRPGIFTIYDLFHQDYISEKKSNKHCIF